MPRFIARTIFLLVISVCLTAFANISVVESTPSRLILNWEIQGFDTVTVSAGGVKRTHISFEGGHVITGDSGSAQIPGYSLYAGVPAQGAARVSVEPEEFTTLRLSAPLHKRPNPSDPMEPVFSSRWISDPSYTALRDYRAAQLVIRPVHNLGQGRLQVLRKARIVIDFPAASHNGAAWEPESDYERMVKRLLINYKIAQGWQQSDRRTLRKSAEIQDQFPFTVNQQLAAFKVGARGNEVSPRNNTLIKISGRKIRELFGSNVPINSVALYASVKGELNENVPKEGEIPAGVFEVPIMRPDKSGNVGSDDYFVACVSGTSDWSYNTASQRYVFALNRYDNQRTYWLAIKNGGGETMNRFIQPGESGGVSEDFENNVYIGTPRVLADRSIAGGIDWVWKKFGSAGRADTTVQLDLPGLDKKSPGSISLEMHSRSFTKLNAYLGPNVLCTNCNSNEWSGITTWESTNLRINNTDPGVNYELEGLHLRYRRPIVMPESGGALEVFSSCTSGVRQYRLNKTGNELTYIVRVPIDEKNISLIDTVKSGTAWRDVGNQGTRYIVMAAKDIVDYSNYLERVDYKLPTGVSSGDGGFLIRNLRNTGNVSGYLIITHQDFLAASLALARHKDSVGFNSPRVVLLSDVQNQFGGGNMDPASIRNFLLFVYRNWDRGKNLDFVTLMGSGHYDYKNISSRSVNFMPVAYRTNGNDNRYNKVTDDYFVFLDTAVKSDSQHYGYYFIGRLPARSSTEAFDMVEKIVEMESPALADFDSWRNRVLLTADDDLVGSGTESIEHYASSEKVAEIIEKNRPSLDLRKLYLFEYERNEHYNKPAATRTFINEINGGVSVVNWFGHGNSDQLADERIFSKDDIYALYNRKRYPLFSFFSCSVGKFDHPGSDCLSAQLVRQPRAGAIAVISAARDVMATANEYLSLPFFEALFHSTDNLPVGAALTFGKYGYRNQDNRYYILLGDPSITFSRQHRKIDLAIKNESGVSLDTLKALQQISIKGSVNDFSGRKDVNFSGGSAFVNLTLFNASYTTRRKDGGTRANPEYILPGSPVFSAKVPVKNGEFEQSLLLPMNLSFGKPGVRLTAYAWKDTLTGSGFLSDLIFEGSESNKANDTAGPQISIRPVYNIGTMDQSGIFVKNRVTAQLPLTLEVSVADESGVSVIGTGPDEGLTMEIAGALSKRSINHLFQFSEGSFHQGIATVTFEENSIKSGVYEFIVSSQDLLGNVSRQSFTLEILDQMDLKLDHVLNIPNPVKMGRETRFYYYHSNTNDFAGSDVTAIIRVYSLGGRLLAVIRNPVNGQPWIPKDERGNLLSPNVYLYQVSVSSASQGKSAKSKIKKLMVHPPR
ncbi:MAG: C25 family cysteine peptidase [Chitinispirillales bacterium]|jgi:hypothetical protein|nr:C25 family cysteine peptidase [Chitinispirillales bacterium]